MWCPACRADVAAELSSDSLHFQCARCATELGTAVGSAGSPLSGATNHTDAERNARDLLARWNAENLLERPLARSPVAPEVPELPSKISESLPMIERNLSETSPPEVQNVSSKTPLPRKRRRRRRIDATERQIDSESHPIDHEPLPRKPANWGMTVGQICAYFGTGLITCGTAVVVWSFFGGPSQVAPTGWLVTTVGQMFLFLGVVTLISSGMEQTSADVAARIDQIGQRLLRMERQNQQDDLHGPHHRASSRISRRNSSAGSEETSVESV